MKKLIFIPLLFIVFVLQACNDCDSTIKQAVYIAALKTNSELQYKIDSLVASNYVLQHKLDSINSSTIVLTEELYVKAYKYDRLHKYYKLCKAKPTQWKFYKGWSTRVFEQ